MDAGTATSRIFVYGTLRRGAQMHALLGESARWLGAARFRGCIWDFGAYPGVTDSARKVDQVYGEVYELSGEDRESVLDRPGRYEGEGFERAERTVDGEGGETWQAFVFIFLGSTRRARRIESGDYVLELRTRDRATRSG